jgi:hypothetical protein
MVATVAILIQTPLLFGDVLAGYQPSVPAIDMQNVLVSNYSHLDSARFPYFELLVISLWKSFHILQTHVFSLFISIAMFL